ncbi:uncharacterized protein LOC120328539 [Styela clava]
MPTVTLTMSNGHNPVSGISFRQVKTDGSNGSAWRPYSSDDVSTRRHVNSTNGNGVAERSSSDNKKSDAAGIDIIRMRLKRGKNGGNRNARVYETQSDLSYHNNNGPIKAFPISNGKNNEVPTNVNDSNLLTSAPDLSSLPSSESNSAQCTPKINNRQPLQRIHGHGLSKQRLPPGLTDAQTPVTSNGNTSTSHSLPPSPTFTITKQTLAVSNHQPSPLKSAMHRNDANGNVRRRHSKDGVTFVDSELPPGIHELVKDFFVPGAKGCFQHKTEMPLLISTDSAILKRRSSISNAKKNRVPPSPGNQGAKPKAQQISALRAEDNTNMARSRSSASDVFVQPDMQILKACWNVILSFMGDDSHSLQKHRSLGSIVTSKKKYFGNSKKLWRKSSADSSDISSKHSPNSTIKGEVNLARPTSMFVPSSPPMDAPTSTELKRKKVSKPHSSSTSFKSTTSPMSYLSVLEKVHFLVNVGLKLPYLRDEIYCLVIKQLINNPSQYSTALGWILLALVMGSFSPSTKVLALVEKFINHHRHAWSNYCSERLRRTVQNGPRVNPPCSVEIKAATIKEPILFPVICADHSVRTVPVDPASTSKEILESMADKNRIKEHFGFCVVLQSSDKIINLGSGRFSIMDAFSQVEIYAGHKFNKTNCRLYYRRDIFSPRDLFCASDEHMSTWLTFSQICGGVHTGEYFCKKAQDLSLLAAHQYCVRHGIEFIDEKRVAAVCDQCLPHDVYKSDKKNWLRMVTNTLRALARKHTQAMNPVDIMAQVIRYAMHNLTSYFIRTYSITTFAMVGGACTYTSDLSLSLSHEGVTVRQGNDTKLFDRAKSEESDVETIPVILMDVPAKNLKKVKLETQNPQLGTNLTITVHTKRSYEITSAHGPEIYAVLFRYIRDIKTAANKESCA